MTGKMFGLFITGIFVAVLAFQVTGASAHGSNKPLTGPVTSPLTSPSTCKPGWGWGDRNHCHFGAPGFLKKIFSFNFNFNHHDNKGHNDDHGHNNHH